MTKEFMDTILTDLARILKHYSIPGIDESYIGALLKKYLKKENT